MTKKITILALSSFLPLVADAALEQVWLPGVSESGGWSDFDKHPTIAGDDNLCWAASAANIINWWQKRYEIPENTPQGEAIWTKFKNSFTDVGGSPDKGFMWWLDGTYDTNNSSGYATLKDGATAGYYFKPWNSSAARYVTSAVGNYATMSKHIIDFLSAGVGLTIAIQGYPHQVTLWGAEYDESTNLITRLWITDSDDEQKGYDQGGLFDVACYETTIHGANYLGFRTEDNSLYNSVGKDYAVAVVYGLKPADFLTPIPEPSAFGLLAGLGALALAGTRRSRKTR